MKWQSLSKPSPVSLSSASRLTSDSWTKLLPKSGPKFTDALQHLKDCKIPEWAAKYSRLQEKIIQHKLDFLGARAGTMRGMEQAGTSIPFPVVTSSMNTPLSIGFYQDQGMEDIPGDFMYDDDSLSQWDFFQGNM
jgi:hypothetical protein